MREVHCRVFELDFNFVIMHMTQDVMDQASTTLEGGKLLITDIHLFPYHSEEEMRARATRIAKAQKEEMSTIKICNKYVPTHYLVHHKTVSSKNILGPLKEDIDDLCDYLFLRRLSD